MAQNVYEVSSEIYAETDFKPIKTDNGTVISKFTFTYPSNAPANVDGDGDLVVNRRSKSTFDIEHSGSTTLKLVGLQVWRGALLLADYLFHNCTEFKEKQILELGAGVGLTSLAAAIYCKKVICTDVDLGGILNLIRSNVKRNRSLINNDIAVAELDFYAEQLSDNMKSIITDTDIVIAADVIYDDNLTDGLISILDKILDTEYDKPKTFYTALEKRYVFTIAELETSAPCFDYFLKKVSNKPWTIEYIPINFPQYFEYERCKELVLLKITRK